MPKVEKSVPRQPRRPTLPGTRTTLTMVAERAGVSPSTVSRILNGTAQVSEEKQQLVRSVIEELNFRPDPAARSLAGGRAMSIGVLTQFIDSPYYGEALRGIEDVVQKANYSPLFVSGHWNEAEEKNRLYMLQERKVDGIIVLTGKLKDETLIDVASSIPVVVTGRQLSGPNVFSIDFDNVEGACLAVRHLYALGHQRVAFISGPLDHSDAVQRVAGFRSELLRKNMTCDEGLIVYSDFQESGGFRAMNQLLETHQTFSAVIAANDQMAYGARLALYRAGIRVPEDVSIVGFDDLPHSAFTLPPLTTVRQSIYEVGVRAAQALFELIEGKAVAPIQIPAELVVRESTRIYRR